MFSTRYFASSFFQAASPSAPSLMRKSSRLSENHFAGLSGLLMPRRGFRTSQFAFMRFTMSQRPPSVVALLIDTPGWPSERVAMMSARNCLPLCGSDERRPVS